MTCCLHPAALDLGDGPQQWCPQCGAFRPLLPTRVAGVFEAGDWVALQAAVTARTQKITRLAWIKNLYDAASV